MNYYQIPYYSSLPSFDIDKSHVQIQKTRKEFDGDEKIAAVISIFDALKIKETTKKSIKDFYAVALSSLDRLNRPEDRKMELYNFASFLLNRNR